MVTNGKATWGQSLTLYYGHSIVRDISSVLGLVYVLRKLALCMLQDHEARPNRRLPLNSDDDVGTG